MYNVEIGKKGSYSKIELVYTDEKTVAALERALRRSETAMTITVERVPDPVEEAPVEEAPDAE